MNIPITQDLETLIIRGKNAHVKSQQQRSGQTTATKKNQHQLSGSAVRAAKLDSDTETTKVKKIPREVANKIREARCAKTPTWTQKDLAKKTNMTIQDIQKYENGTAVVDGNYHKNIAILSRKLGTKLSVAK